MPWKECSVMDERLRLVAKLLEGESMSEVCRQFGDLPQDRLQDLQSIQGARIRGAER
jgi:transposase-like protein